MFKNPTKFTEAEHSTGSAMLLYMHVHIAQFACV